jgi:hypothetical protein
MDVWEPLEDWQIEQASTVSATLPEGTLIASTAVPAEPTLADLPIGKHTHENLSGTAGTGKTYTAKQLIELSPPGSVALAATTGIAAVNLGEGTTINALLKYFNTKDLQERYTTGILQSVLRKLRRSGLRRILIDEKSMLSGQQLTLITRACDEVNKPKSELEGVGDDSAQKYADEYELSEPEEDQTIGITLVGDFGQLPPIADEDERTGKKIPLQFAFDSPEWSRYGQHTTTLTKIWRQDAQDFVQALHAVRKAQIQSALAFFTPQRFENITDDQFEGTTIFAKNDAVERYNQLRLDALNTPAMTYDAVRKGIQRGDWKQIPQQLQLKEGALVMILANRRVYEDEFDDAGRIIYANGDLGVIKGVDPGRTGWAVELQRTGKIVNVLPIVRENTIPLEPGRRKEMIAQGIDLATAITEKGKGRSEIIGTIMYMPLRAAYGCTVHKTQGLTLDKVQVNIRDPFFRNPGMLFVALSRARTIDGLRIVGNQIGFIERCRIEPRVQPWL